MAKSRSIGGIYAELSLRDSKFRKGLKSAKTSLGNFAKSSVKAGAMVSGAMGAALAFGTKKTIAYGAELDHMSSQTGLAVSSLIKIGQAYKDAGKDAGSAGKDIGKMQRAIFEAAEAPGTTVDYFADLGLSAEKLMAMSPEEQFYEIGKALKETKNQTKQAALALQIFGRSGGQLLTVFKGTNLDDVNESLGRMPEIMEKFSGSMERADTLMGRLPNKSQQFFAGFTSGVIDQLLPALEKVDDHDFTTLGENLGKSIADGLAMLTDGTAWELFLLHAQKTTLAMQGSATNSWLATFANTMGDMVTTSDWDWDFDETWEQYEQGGIMANAEIAADLEEKIRAANLKIERNRKKRTTSDGVESVPFLGSLARLVPDLTRAMDKLGTKIPDAFSDAMDSMTGEDPEEKEERRQWERTSVEVNSMQARGLGFGATYVDPVEKKKVSLLEEIKQVLSRAETGGELRWT
jgi:hypothetical protein